MTAATVSKPPQEGNGDHTVRHCTDIKEVKAKVEEISDTLNKLAVQEQKLATLFESVNALRKQLDAANERLSRLQQEHDRCQIGAVATDMVWVKWFVMGNTIATLGMVMGMLAHYIKA
jgi:outer membrane murein-binding lipoprotein Lpp